MATLQKALSDIRELKDEEIDLVGGLAGSSTTIEIWIHTTRTLQTPNGPTDIDVVDRVETRTEPD